MFDDRIIAVTKAPRHWSKRSEWINYPNGFVLDYSEGLLFLLETNKVHLIGVVPDSYFEDLLQDEFKFNEAMISLVGT